MLKRTQYLYSCFVLLRWMTYKLFCLGIYSASLSHTHTSCIHVLSLTWFTTEQIILPYSMYMYSLLLQEVIGSYCWLVVLYQWVYYHCVDKFTALRNSLSFHWLQIPLLKLLVWRYKFIQMYVCYRDMGYSVCLCERWGEEFVRVQCNVHISDTISCKTLGNSVCSLHCILFPGHCLSASLLSSLLTLFSPRPL